MFNDTISKSKDPEAQRRLAAMLAEAKQRGIKIDSSVLKSKRIEFPTDENGYFVRDDGRQFSANEHQENFIGNDARFIGLFSGRGGGKSASGSQKALKKVAQGESGAIMNPSFENFRFSTWKEFKRWVPWNTVVPHHRRYANPEWMPQKPFHITFLNGASIYCKGLRDPDSARGPNINWLWYDEGGSDLTGEGWNIAIASVRVGHKPQAWVTTTPNGVLHWMHDFFIDRNIPDEVFELFKASGEERELISAAFTSISANKENLDAGFYASMVAAYGNTWQRQQELEGRFVAQGGVLGNPAWFDGKMMDSLPKDLMYKNRIRYWDLAATEKKIAGRKLNDPDKTVGTLMSYAPKQEGLAETLKLVKHPSDSDPAFFIEDQVSGHWEYDTIVDTIYKTALLDGHFVKIRVEQEPGSGGKNQIAAIRKEIYTRCQRDGIPRFDFDGHRPEGDKVMRAGFWFGEARKGIVYIINGEWVKPFFSVLGGFPLMKHDDEVDSVSGARACSAPFITWKAVKFLHLGSMLNGKTNDSKSQ